MKAFYCGIPTHGTKNFRIRRMRVERRLSCCVFHRGYRVSTPGCQLGCIPYTNHNPQPLCKIRFCREQPGTWPYFLYLAFLAHFLNPHQIQTPSVDSRCEIGIVYYLALQNTQRRWQQNNFCRYPNLDSTALFLAYWTRINQPDSH